MSAAYSNRPARIIIKGVKICLPSSNIDAGPQIITDLSWEEAKRQMNEWVGFSKKADRRVATWTYWAFAGYTIKLYTVDGAPLVVYKTSGDHGVVRSGKFAYKTQRKQGEKLLSSLHMPEYTKY